MTYKSALVGLGAGGGKAVVIADSGTCKTEALLSALGRAIESFKGRFITGEDVGSSVEDLEIARRETAHVRGIVEDGAGDPSPATAHGVFHGLRAAAARCFGSPDLRDRRIAVQGIGHVGAALIERPH